MLSQYRAVLSKPGALVFSSAAWVGRLWLSMTNLGILLLITATTHRYGMAGAVSATYVIVGAVTQPLPRAAHRPASAGRVLLPMVAGARSLGVVALLLCAETGERRTGRCSQQPRRPACARRRWARWSARAGRSCSEAGAPFWTPRTRWSRCSTARIVTGPVLVTVLSTTIDPAVGLLTALALTLAGTIAFGLQKGTQPQASLGSPRSATVRRR